MHSYYLDWLKELKSIYKKETLFTDSSTVLSWIRPGEIKYKTYIKNKLIEIQELHPIDVRQYIPGRENTTADTISKVCKYKDLERIIRGVKWLYHKRERWSWSTTMILIKEEIDSEKNSKFIVNPMTTNDSIINIERFSSWRKLLRVTAYVMRIASQNDREKSKGTGAHLNAEEIKKAERF